MIRNEETSTFAERIANVLQRVEFQRADTPAQKEAIFRMRYEAYSREGYIEPNCSGIFTDPDDNCPNAWLIAIFIEGRLASSIRLHIGSRPEHFLPVAKGFPDLVVPRLEAGQIIVDASRMTSRLEFTRAYPFLPYLTMRAAFLAMEHFGADYITAAIREEYQAAYRRMYGAANWSAPRPYPPLTRLQALMAYDCKAMWAKTRDRYPFEASTSAERSALYARSSNAEHDPYEELTAGRRAPRAESMQHSTARVA